MNKDINYPIKYAVLELKEGGGYSVGYQNITQGFIASKCYVIESAISYNQDGSNKIIHKVVFPYSDIETFKNTLRYDRPNIGKAKIPKYDASGKIYPVWEVAELFDSFIDAKEMAIRKKEDYKSDLISNVPAPIGYNYSNKSWQEQHEELKQEFEEKQAICDSFESLVLEATFDMEIIKEITTNDEIAFVKVLKPTKYKR